MEKILVAVDSSKNAQKVLIKAREIGSIFNSKITILHVIENLADPSTFYASYTIGYAAEVQKELEEQSEKLLVAYMEKFKDYKGMVDAITRKGKPANVINEISEEGSYDLIVIGSRGLGAFSGAMLGSVSHKVVNKSKMSVLVVK